MTRFLIHRLLVFAVRIGGVAGILLILLEIGFGWLREDSIHVWNLALMAPLPVDFSPTGQSPFLFVREAFFSSTPIFIISFLGIWICGYGWGVLGARFRRVGGAHLLRLPFAVGASFSGFWIVILVALYSYLVWERPGFADEIRVDQGPDLVMWWNASVVSLPLILVGSNRLLRAVGEVLKEKSCRLEQGAFFLLGESSENVFYRRVFRRSLKELAELFDRSVPVMLGGLVIVETAFQYDGVGAAFVKGLREGEVSVVFFSALGLAVCGGFFALFRECLVYSIERREG